jgi:hypothetical protein
MSSKQNDSGSVAAGSGATDSSLLRTLLTKGPQAFKRHYDDYLTDKYVRPGEDGEERPLGTAYATAQHIAADMLIPDSPEEAAVAMFPVGSVGRIGKQGVRALRKEAKPLAKAAEEVAEKASKGVGELVDDVTELLSPAQKEQAARTAKGLTDRTSDTAKRLPDSPPLDYGKIRAEEVAKERSREFGVAELGKGGGIHSVRKSRRGESR